MLEMQAKTQHTASNTLTDMDVLSEQQYAAERASTIGIASTNDFRLYL